MNDKKKLVKSLNIVFWVLLVLTIVLAFREYQYLANSAPSSGNWEIDTSNTPINSYIYDWISYINIVLVGLSGILTFAIYQIKKNLENQN